MRRVWPHSLDVANPRKEFSVDPFKSTADKKIKEIIERGKVPILCGGTGFYIDAVVQNISFPNVPPNPKLRKKLTKKSASTLFKILHKLDPRRAKTIQKENKVRLIRAIEICKSLGKVPHLEVEPPSKYEVLYIGTLWRSGHHKERIRKRLVQRIKASMINEAKSLHRQGLSWKRMHELGLEYRYLALYLQGKISKQ